MDKNRSSELTYIKLDQDKLNSLYEDMDTDFDVLINPDLDFLPDHKPVAPCVKCGRFTSDPTRISEVEIRPNHHFSSEEEKEAVCEQCRTQEIEEASEKGTLKTIEDKLGIAEKDRDNMRALVRSIVTGQDKILQVKELNLEVKQLEKQITRMWTLLITLLIGVIITLLTLLLTIAFGAL